VDLNNVIAEKSEFLQVAKFYLGLINALISKTQEFRKELGIELKSELGKVNGWKDPKARAVVSSFDPTKGPEATMKNLERMMAEGVLLEEDIPILKKVMLSYITALIIMIEEKADSTISKLLFRLSSCDCIEDARNLIDSRSLLSSIPEVYLKQI
jgi:hypothetical protein